MGARRQGELATWVSKDGNPSGGFRMGTSTSSIRQRSQSVPAARSWVLSEPWPRSSQLGLPACRPKARSGESPSATGWMSG